MTERRVGPKARALIKSFEGCKLKAYPDPGSGNDPWTIGWGSTGPGIAKGVTWTQDQCDTRFDQDVQAFGAQVSAAIGAAPTTPAQFGALTAFSYNVGLGALRKSTLLKKHLAGDYEGAAAEFLKWNRAGGKVMTGLTRRRQAESQFYRDGDK